MNTTKLRALLDCKFLSPKQTEEIFDALPTLLDRLEKLEAVVEAVRKLQVPNDASV